MKTALRVLLVEDSELDAKLIVRQLTNAGYEVESRRVDTEKEFREALNAATWDIAICDHTLPQFNAPTALSLLKDSGLEIPFIVVSGNIRTDVAVEMMRQGARDYLMKGDLARFVPAVERELQEQARRRDHRQSELARQMAEESSRVSEQRYRELYQTTTDIIFSILVDESGKLLFEHCNAPCERVMGLSSSRDEGRPLEEALPELVRCHCLDLVHACLKSGEVENCDCCMENGNETIYFHNTLHPIKDAEGHIRKLIVVARDITERKRGEEALRKAHSDLERRVRERTAELTAANSRLRELDRLKSEFLATMSHELRTPLNSIIGFTSLVKEEITGPLNEEQKKQLNMVYSASKHLLGLINDLLDVSRIEAGRLKLDTDPFDFCGVVAETIAQIKPLAMAKRLVIRPQLPRGPIPMLGDRRRCLQVLINLTHNAVKFTEKGTVDVVIKTEDSKLHVDVIDTGIGIKAEHMNQLFEAFRQIDGSARRSYEGTGLGLYLCRKLLHLMGGEITAHSVEGKGTRISFEMPRMLAPESPHSVKSALPHEKHHITCRG